MHTYRRIAGLALAGTAGALLFAAPASPQQAAAPIARYTIDAGTLSGMAAMAQAGSGLGAAMNVLRGGNQVAHELQLRLGSSRAPTGEPKADHFMPQGARLGASVPLVTPQRAPAAPPGPGGMPPQAQMPTGRLLLFWGCGEHAPAGQPVVIDFSKLARGQMPAGLFAQAVNLPNEWSVTQANSRTFGEWPNERDSKRVDSNASLLGAHRVASTYAPEIAFDLAQDFMPALAPASRDLASGAVALSWNALAPATGYYAWAIGMNPDSRGQSRDMVWWASSSTQQFGGALADWLSPAAVARLVAAKTVMPPSQTACTIPSEVKQAGGPIMMTQLYAYGPQVDFAYPPRPAAARAAWKPEWIARVRYRANAMIMPGMPGMGQGAGGDERSSRQQPPSSGKPKCPGGLRGIAQRAAGLCE
jgi:hypothetical protein